LVIFILLLSGWVFFQLVNPGVPDDLADPGFRSWFWEYRALDLIVQVVLVFSGALGIAALLPVEDNDD
jgi:hypothetical protein